MRKITVVVNGRFHAFDYAAELNKLGVLYKLISTMPYSKAKKFGFSLKGAVMASDAFFPFPDCVEIAHKEGINLIIQPGGSVKDGLTIDYCNEHGIKMVFTGIRHFKH